MRKQLPDLPCPSRRKFSHLAHTVSCWGRNGHDGPHWCGRGLRWEKEEEA